MSTEPEKLIEEDQEPIVADEAEPSADARQAIEAEPIVEESIEPEPIAEVVQTLEEESVEEDVESPVESELSEEPEFETPAEIEPDDYDEQYIAAAHKRSTAKKQTSRSKSIALTVFMILIILAACVAGWLYWWVTHAVFDYELRPVVILEGQSFEAADFLADVPDMRAVSSTLVFPDHTPAPGAQLVFLELQNGMRSLSTAGTLYVLTPVSNIRREHGVESSPIDAIDVISNADIASHIMFSITFLEQPLPFAEYDIGEYDLRLSLNGHHFSVPLIIADTTPPMAVPVEQTIPMGQEVYPEMFVAEVFDASGILSIHFTSEPNVYSPGNQVVEVALFDIYGNERIISAHLNVQRNEIPPTFEGIPSIIYGVIDSPLPVDDSVVALDAFGRELAFEVDTSQVNFAQVGEYIAIFWVEDCCGNRAQEEVPVELHNIDPLPVITEVDLILAEILTDGMSQVDETRAIFEWVRRNLTLDDNVPENNPESSIEGAAIALERRRGNNLVWQAISEVLLTRAGIQNMRISNPPATGDDARTPFVWSLVNPDDRGWHHFDSMPSRVRNNQQMFMMTQAQANQLERDLEWMGTTPNRGRYRFTAADFPEIVR